MWSLAMYPALRRLPQGSQHIKFENGVSFSTPKDEPLLHLLTEVWEEQRYISPGWPQTLPPGDIVDIGAHMGIFTLWAATRWPGRKVVAIEPNPLSFEYLIRNITESRVEKVVPVNSACGEYHSKAILYQRGYHAMNTLFEKDNYGSEFSGNKNVYVVTLDDLFSQHQISQCALMKIDCEGAEYGIIRAADDATLKKCLRIAMEYHLGMNDGTPERIAARLEPLGFRVDIHPPIDEEGGYLYAININAEGTSP